MTDTHRPDPGVIKSIQNAQDILCVSHIGPDGDAIGSLTGMGQILRRLGKRPTLALQDAVPEDFLDLPGADAVIGPQDVGHHYDLIVCLDASSQDRMGKVYREERHSRIPLAVIDHHITNTYFGTMNWVDAKTAATCQMLVYLADDLGVPLDKSVAHCLLTGLITDTLCFRTSNTSAEVLAVATRLMQAGIDISTITAKTLNRRPYSVLQLWGRALSDMQLEDGVIWAVVTQEDLKAVSDENGDAQLSSTLVTAAEADMSAVFTERVGDDGRLRVECSFRAKPGFNVGDVALSFGGGGHAPASGCTIDGALESVTATVVQALKEARSEQLNAASA